MVEIVYDVAQMASLESIIASLCEIHKFLVQGNISLLVRLLICTLVPLIYVGENFFFPWLFEMEGFFPPSFYIGSST